MSNRGYTCKAKRTEIIQRLMANLSKLTDKDAISRAAVAPFFDIVATLFYCSEDKTLPHELDHLVVKYPCVPWLQDMILDSLNPQGPRRQEQDPPPPKMAEAEAAAVETILPSVPVEVVKPPPAEPQASQKADPVKYGHINTRLEEFVQYVRMSKPKTVDQLATYFKVHSSTIRRVLYGLRYAKVNLDVPRKVLWAHADSGDSFIATHVLETLKKHPLKVKEYSLLDAPPKPQVEPLAAAAAPPSADTLATMVLRAAQAGDGEAAVKLAQMQTLFDKYGK